MELDELKSLWQRQKPSGNAHSEQDIQAILKQKTHPILNKIYSKFYIEMVGSSIIIMVLIGFYIYLKEYAMATVAILITGIGGYVYWLFYMLVNINFSKDTLHAALRKMERLFRFYDKVVGWFKYIVGTSFFFGYFLGRVLNQRLEWDYKWLVALGIIIVASISLTYPVKWYLHLVYGQHIQELKMAYVELNDIEQEG